MLFWMLPGCDFTIRTKKGVIIFNTREWRNRVQISYHLESFKTWPPAISWKLTCCRELKTMSWYLFGQLRPGRSFLDSSFPSHSYIFDFPVGSFHLILEDIGVAPFLPSSKDILQSHFFSLYNFIYSTRPKLSITSYIMAVVSSPTLTFQALERHEVSNALESSATLQDPISSSKSGSSSEDRYLVVSPYDEKPHLLDLETLDKPNQLLARALLGLKCLREDYATAPYVETFNVCFSTLQSNVRGRGFTDFFSGKEL